MSIRSESDQVSNDASVHRTWFDGEESTSITYGVVEAIATLDNTTPTEIDLMLYDAIDPDALNALYRRAQKPGGEPWKIEFGIEQYEISVRSDGGITVRDCERTS